MIKFDFGAMERRVEADWPVIVPVPQDGGKLQEQTLQVRFQLLDESEEKEIDAGEDAGRERIRRAVLGFAGSEQAEFTPELLEAMLNRPYVRLALNKAYAEFSVGVAPKNSLRSRG